MVKDKILIVLAGPTAVGKTDCAINLAKKYNAHIISADSRQLYQEMNIGTAKPSTEEMGGIPHHFIDHLSIHDPYSVGQYEREVISFLPPYFDKHNTAILTGGTGLYIKAITEGLDDFPVIPLIIKQDLQNIFDAVGIEPLQNELKREDPDYFNKVDINNPQRLIRALSVIRQSGKSFSSFLSKTPKERFFKPIFILLERERQELYERINLRVDIMIKNGLIEEAKTLFPHRHLTALQTVGYQELFNYFESISKYSSSATKIIIEI